MAWTDNYKRYDTSDGFGTKRKWKATFRERMTVDEANECIEHDSPEGILGITESHYTFEYLKEMFKAKIMVAHPDRGGSTEEAQKVIAAYTILKNKMGEK